MLGGVSDIFKCFKIPGHKRCDEVKSVILMLGTQAIDTNSLLVVEAEEIELLTMQAAIYWDGW